MSIATRTRDEGSDGVVKGGSRARPHLCSRDGLIAHHDVVPTKSSNNMPFFGQAYAFGAESGRPDATLATEVYG